MQFRQWLEWEQNWTEWESINTKEILSWDSSMIWIYSPVTVTRVFYCEILILIINMHRVQDYSLCCRFYLIQSHFQWLVRYVKNTPANIVLSSHGTLLRKNIVLFLWLLDPPHLWIHCFIFLFFFGWVYSLEERRAFNR